MTRKQAVVRIGNILDTHCANCPTKQELNRVHGSCFARIDKHCNRECSVGQQLQGLSKYLTRA